jgi:hypothetical protein
MRYDLTRMQVESVMLNLRDAFDEDEQLKLDTLEGETNLFELARRILDGIESDEGDSAALAEQMEARKVRKDRCSARIKARRQALIDLMACAEIDKLPLPEATLSVRQTAAKLAVNEAAGVPDEYSIPVMKPSMDLIKAAFSTDTPDLPNWLRVEDPRPSLTVRRK